MNAALEQLLRSSRYNITQIDGDRARYAARKEPLTPEEMWHQGYQTGRKAELESLVSLLEIALGTDQKAEP